MTVSIGTKDYASIKEAEYAFQPGDVIKLGSNVTEDVEIFGNRFVVIDLNGNTLSNVKGPTVSVLSSATLRIMDSVGGGVIDSTLNSIPAILVEAKATLYLEGGDVTRSAEDSDANTAYCIMNYGSTSILKGSKVVSTSTKNAAVKNGFDTSKPTDSKYIADVGYDYTANMTISSDVTGGSIAVKNDEYGALTVTGGKITASREAILTWSPCTISGGEFVATEGSAVTFGTNKGPAGFVAITGGRFTGSDSTGPVAPISTSKTHVVPKITGGFFNKAPEEGYYPKDLEIRAAADGFFYLAPCMWDIMDSGISGIGFSGMRKLILHKDVWRYQPGGFELPFKLSSAVLVAVTAKGGVTGYYNNADNKLQLYHGASEVKAVDVEDLTIVFLTE